MAVPAYVLAFVAVATLDYAGVVPTALRAWFGADLAVPPIRSTGGVIAVLGFASYPYVYLMARGAFLTHGARVLEAAQSLGYGPWSGLVRVAIPLARPWLAGGAALVAMETLADFGAVSVFNYDTFTTAIYKAWYGLFSVETALGARAAAARLRGDRARRRAVRARARRATRRPIRATAPRCDSRSRARAAGFACAFAAAVFAAGFLLPGIALVRWALEVAPLDLDARYVAYILRTLGLAGDGGARLPRARPRARATRIASSSGIAAARGRAHRDARLRDPGHRARRRRGVGARRYSTARTARSRAARDSGCRAP